MTNPIKIAGLGSDWTERYAKLYKEKLCEVGFEAKILNISGRFYVVYSYRIFTTEEIDNLLKELFGEKNDEVE